MTGHREMPSFSGPETEAEAYSTVTEKVTMHSDTEYLMLMDGKRGVRV